MQSGRVAMLVGWEGTWGGLAGPSYRAHVNAHCLSARYLGGKGNLDVMGACRIILVYNLSSHTTISAVDATLVLGRTSTPAV